MKTDLDIEMEVFEELEKFKDQYGVEISSKLQFLISDLCIRERKKGKKEGMKEIIGLAESHIELMADYTPKFSFRKEKKTYDLA